MIKQCFAQRRSSLCFAEEGFTLIELIITLVILAILLALAAPSFYAAGLSGKLAGHATELRANAQLARSEAIKRNIGVKLCVSSNGTSCGSGNWKAGWIVLAGTTVLHAQGALSSGIEVNSTVSEIVFQPSGLASTPATLIVCRKSPTVGDSERVVTVTATGKTSVAKTSNGVCL